MYVDARPDLPEDEQYISEITGRKIKNIGNKWSEFQEVNFQEVIQPLYVILGHDNLEPLVEKNAYNLDVEAYISWLDRGVAAFEK